MFTSQEQVVPSSYSFSYSKNFSFFTRVTVHTLLSTRPEASLRLSETIETRYLVTRQVQGTSD